MMKLGLIGYPVGHSLSPKIQNAALKACGLNGEYSLYPIEPADMQALKDLLGSVRSGEITGLNVTIPHKQNVIQFLDELTPTAKTIGAVSVIYLWDHKLIGDNADAHGFLTDLKKVFDFSSLAAPSAALILGAGGSARAVVHALINDGWNVTVAARRIEQARELAMNFEGTNVLELDPQNSQLSNFQLIVNTTPLGMTPNIHASPLPENIRLPSHARVYDLVYNPRETKLVRDARSQGLNARTGLGMLIEQAALAFELWTGHNPPREILWKTVETDN